MAEKVVSNSSPLIHAARAGFLEILQRLYDQVLVPRAVYREVVEEGLRVKAADALAVQRGVDDGWIVIRPLWRGSAAQVRRVVNAGGLSRGEAEVVVLALHEGVVKVLMDERSGTAVARALGLRPVGLLGVLIEAMAQGVIDFPEVEHRLGRLIASEFHLSHTDYERAIALAKQVWAKRDGLAS